MNKFSKKITTLLIAITLVANVTTVFADDETPATTQPTTTSDGEAENSGTNNPTENQQPRTPSGLTRAQQQEISSVEEAVEEEALSIQENNFNDALRDLGTCLPTMSFNRSSICNEETLKNNASDEFERLQKALLNQEIITVIEEPIGTENIFKKARVCKTMFLKDSKGHLQNVQNSFNAEGIYRENGTITQSDFANQNFLITVDECLEFYVEKCTPQNNTQTTIQGGNPLPIQVFCGENQLLFATSGSGIIKNYVGLVYRWATGIIGVLAVVVIMINGILISLAGGDSGKIDSAKKRIGQSLLALAILFLSGILLYTINPNFYTTEDLQNRVQQQNPSGSPTPKPEDDTDYNLSPDDK